MITGSMVEKGRVPVAYEGWGFAYPFFYGFEVIAGALKVLGGIDILPTMVFIIPLLAALLVIPVFLITREVFASDQVALLAALFVSVSPPGIFVTSHPMPGAMGDLFGLLVFYWYLRLRPGRTSLPVWICLFLTITCLMMVHHLSSYIVFISLGCYTVVREVLHRTGSWELRRDALILYIFMIFMIVHWLILLQPFRDRIVSDAFGIDAWIIMGGAVGALTVVMALLTLRGRIPWEYRPRYPDITFLKRALAVVSAISIFALVGIAFIGVPGTSVDIDPLFVLLAIPLFIMVILASPGPGYARFYPRGLFIISWLAAILLSLVITAATDNRVLLPYRHTQYLFEPLLILSALAVVELVRMIPRLDTHRARILTTAGLVVLSLGVAHSGYPPREVIANFQEGTVYEEMQGVYWVREYRGDLGGTVATDHRISSMLFGMGETLGTWDSAPRTIHEENITHAREEIEREGIRGVFMTREVRKGAAMLQWENAEPVSDTALAKFEEPPFLRVMDSGFVQVYWMDLVLT